MNMSNKLYDLLKKCVTMYIPALMLMLITINNIWSLGFPMDQINATVTAVLTFLGVLLNISTSNYWKAEETEIDPEQ